MTQAIAGSNLNDYVSNKALGKVTLVKVGDATVLLATQKYDPNTGAPTQPDTLMLNLGNCSDMRASLAAQQASIDAASAALNALEADIKVALG